MTEEQQGAIAIPENVRRSLVELTQAIEKDKMRFNAFLLGAMTALGVDAGEWRISPDGQWFVKQEPPPEEPGEDGDAV